MGRLLYFLCLMCCSFATRHDGSITRRVTNAPTSTESKGQQRHRHTLSPSSVRMNKSGINKSVDHLFDETDSDNNGSISFEEAYVGFLLLYIQLNRQAPIPPPSRDKALLLFLQADIDNSNVLNREQYGLLLQKMVRRAFFRLSSHKLVTWVGAPLLAEVIVRSLASKKEGFERVIRFVVPIKFHDAVIPVVTSKAFHRTLWMLILVVTLGNICLGCVNFLLDLSLPNPSSFPRRWKAYNKNTHIDIDR
jgi:hypothetical protein